MPANSAREHPDGPKSGAKPPLQKTSPDAASMAVESSVAQSLLRDALNAVKLKLFTVWKQPLRDKNGLWSLRGWQFWNQSDSPLASLTELEHVVADQIAWARRIPNFRPCFKNWSSNEQNTVHRYHGTPTARLGGWGVGGVAIYRNQ